MFCSSIYKRVLLLTTELSPFIFGLEVLSKLFNKFSVRKQRAGEAAAGSRERCTVRRVNCERYLTTKACPNMDWKPRLQLSSIICSQRKYFILEATVYFFFSVKHNLQVCCNEVKLDSWTLSYQLKGFLSTTF